MPKCRLFRPLTPRWLRHHVAMDFAAAQYDGTSSLRLRRVLYPTLPAGIRSRVVIEHEPDRGMVTILDTEDGTFWRGRADAIQVLA